MNTTDFVMYLTRTSVEAAVLVLIVFATQRLFRRHLSPQWHCALWLLVIARLLPFSISSDVSLFNVVSYWVHRTAPDVTPTAELGVSGSAGFWLLGVQPQPKTRLPGDAADLSASPPGAVEPVASENSPWTVAFWGWLAGVVGLAGYVAATSFSLHRRLSGLMPLTDPAALSVWRECCDRMRIRRLPPVVESGAIATPALYGLFRPRLLLPEGFTAEYSRAEWRFVFLHELAHLRRRDLPLNWLVTGLQLLHWFNPLLWIAFARWRTDREIACDDLALQTAGASHNRAYGRTMLRLLESVSVRYPRPCLVGILEGKRQLHRRMNMIARPSSARRPVVAIGLLTILALVGLTDAQVVHPPLTDPSSAPGSDLPAPATAVAIPHPADEYVLFLVNGSETMLTSIDGSLQIPDATAVDYRERGRTFVPQSHTSPEALKRAAPKWQHAAQVLEQLLSALPAETNFHVALYADDRLEAIGGRSDSADQHAVAMTISRLRAANPQGAANLESTFRHVAERLKPQRIVLVTDGLPTTSETTPLTGEITEAQRIRAFQLATTRLPPRVPVQTVLLPSSAGDPGAAGLYWELANATHGGLSMPARPGVEPRTHIAFVVDTSGSMRDPNTGGLWPVVIQTIEAALDSQPPLTGVQLLDGDGRFILGRRGNGLRAWLPDTTETREAIQRTLRRYNQDTVSNPVPGIQNALRFLQDKDAPEVRMGIYLLGDEFNSSDRAGVALDRVDALNPRDASGRRPVVINAIGFPTTIRYRFSMGNTGLRFANLMRLLTYEHDGSFVALADL
jgi:beta-lactamase regulating signal transducer with metallopeptidase domain